MRYLIDGYNLLFALGRLNPHSSNSASAWDSARLWLHAQIVRQHGQEASRVQVVYDGLPGRRGPEPGALFAHPREADDLIEDQIHQESDPARLTVVSDDHRVREAARRKGCVVLRCLDYAERCLLRAPNRAVAVEPPEKPSEIDLRADRELFKHLENDPEFKREDWPW